MSRRRKSAALAAPVTLVEATAMLAEYSALLGAIERIDAEAA